MEAVILTYNVNPKSNANPLLRGHFVMVIKIELTFNDVHLAISMQMVKPRVLQCS